MTVNGRLAVGWLIVEALAMVLALVLLPALAPQLGGTEAGNNWLGFILHHAPGPILVLRPTVDEARRTEVLEALHGLGCAACFIGRVEAGAGLRVLAEDGSQYDAVARGWDHFGGQGR